jgi:hypothetical protein
MHKLYDEKPDVLILKLFQFILIHCAHNKHTFDFAKD